MLGANISLAFPARGVLYCTILTAVLCGSVYSITSDEERACQALWDANSALSTRVKFNASRCCDSGEFSLAGIGLACNFDQSAIVSISILSVQLIGVDLEFEEFRLFHQLEHLVLSARGVRVRAPSVSCFPTGLDRLPNLTSLVLSGFPCSPPDDYFANFPALSSLTVNIGGSAAPFPGISRLNSTLKYLAWSGGSTTNLRFPSSWSSLNLTKLDINGMLDRSNVSNFIASLPSLVELTYYDRNAQSNGSNIIPPLPNLLFLDIDTFVSPVPHDMFYGFNSLKHLIVRGSLVRFPTSAFHLQSLKTLELFVPSSLPLEEPDDSWNSTSIATLVIRGSGREVRLPSSLNNLSDLAKIEMTEVRVQQLPANLSGLVNLQWLHFTSVYSDNATAAFQPFATVPNITKLDLYGPGGYEGWIWNLRSLQEIYLLNPLYPYDLSPEIGNLVNLRKLDISVVLAKQFPAEMSLLSNLRFLSLDLGTIAAGIPLIIPSNWSTGMPLLETVIFRDMNLVAGSTFPNFGQMANLRSLTLERISGVTAPPNLLGAISLNEIKASTLDINRLPIIPDGGLPSLSVIDFRDLLSVTEPLPLGYYECSNLQSLNILQVPLTGPLLPQVSRWTQLRSLGLRGVNFNGTLPQELFQLSNLTKVSLNSLPLISGSFDVNPNLQILTLIGTGLTDLVATTQPQTKITNIDLNANRFTTFPTWISQATSLRLLTLTGNGLSSQPFPDLTALVNLRTLAIVNERFTGSLADTFDRLERIQLVEISYTQLEGAIPATMLTTAEIVGLDNNRFTSLPTILQGNCTLSAFSVVSNSLAGSISVLGRCQGLFDINLSSNLLGPVVPTAMLKLPRLTSLTLSSNAFAVFEPQPLPNSFGQSTLPSTVNLAQNNFTGPITDDMLKAIIGFGANWVFTDNLLECPRHLFYSTLATWNKTIGGAVDLIGNYMCFPGNTSIVACTSLFFGPGPAQTGTYRTLRTPCAPYPWKCPGTQPALDAPCIAPGIWLVLGSIQSTVTQPLVIGGNTTVQGNFTVPTGTSVTIVSGATVTVQGCVSISGDLTVDVSQNRPTVNGSSVDVILYDVSVCNSTQTPDFGRVTVIGGGECATIEAQDRVTSRGLSVVFTVYDNPRCRAPAVDGVSSSTAAIVGGVVGSIVVVGAVVAIVLIYKFRDRVVPSFMLHRKLKHFSASPAK